MWPTDLETSVKIGSNKTNLSDEALELVGLSGLNKRSANALLWRPKAACCLARALILKPKVLFARRATLSIR